MMSQVMVQATTCGSAIAHPSAAEFHQVEVSEFGAEPVGRRPITVDSPIGARRTA